MTHHDDTSTHRLFMIVGDAFGGHDRGSGFQPCESANNQSHKTWDRHFGVDHLPALDSQSVSVQQPRTGGVTG